MKDDKSVLSVAHSFIPSSTIDLHTLQRRYDVREVGPLLRVLLPASAHYQHQFRRALAAYLLQRWALFVVYHIIHDLVRRVVGEGWLPRQDLPEDDAVGVDIGFEGVGLVLEDFGSHPVERAGHPGESLAVLPRLAGQSEVSDLALPVVKDRLYVLVK